MTTIEPIKNIDNKPLTLKIRQESRQKTHKARNSLIAGSLSALAIIGAVGIIKTKPMSFEDALKKAGVEIKDNVAKKIGTEELFTGKIKRFETRNKKETTEYVDGIITEKIYHSAFGKELSGTFYIDGKPKYGVGGIGKSRNRFLFPAYEYENGHLVARGEGCIENKPSVFEEYRKLIKKLKEENK